METFFQGLTNTIEYYNYLKTVNQDKRHLKKFQVKIKSLLKEGQGMKGKMKKIKKEEKK